MPGFLDFLEPLFSGNLKYFSGLVLGTLVVLTIRFINMKWRVRQNKADQDFVQKHQGEPIEGFRKKAQYIYYSLIILLVVIMPLSLFLSVKVLDGVLDVEPWLGVLVILVEVVVLIVLVAVQSVRGRRLRRRIKLMEDSITK
jgi:hypothetical protein